MLRPLRARWLGRVPYREAYDLQHRLFEARVAGVGDDYLLLLEHPHVYTLGRRASAEHLLRTEDQYRALGADVVEVDRGGDITYHGPGQLVAYPILRLIDAGRPVDVVRYVRDLEEVVIRTLAGFGIVGFRRESFTGVWTDSGKIAAIGCRVTRGVSMHGTAINVSADLSFFDHIVPCGIRNAGVTSMQELIGDSPAMSAVVERFVEHAGAVFGRLPKLTGVQTHERSAASAPVRLGSMRRRAVEDGPDIREQARARPVWLKRRASLSDPRYGDLRRLVRSLDLNTVCEEAGCPNIYECWGEGTATMMLLGSRCTRSCGFCDVDTAKPLDVDLDEPDRVAEAVEKLGLDHAVLTSVARDDLADGGAQVFADSVRAIRGRTPDCAVEVLVPDFKGDAASAQIVFDVKPDVFNHNLETVARLQRLARPQAGYARSLALLGRAADAGLVTKSGLVAGMGETRDELVDALADLRSVGVGIVTIGQYLRPTGRHLPVDRWVEPAEFDYLRDVGERFGFAHVESGPLVRSSYHARSAAAAGR